MSEINVEMVDVDSFIDFADESASGGSGSGKSQPNYGEMLAENFSYKQVGSIIVATEPVSGFASLDVAVDMFTSDESLKVIPVEENDRVVGVLDRKTVAEATNTAWKRLTSKNIIDYTMRVSTVLNAGDYIEKVLDKVSALNREQGIEYFPVFNGKSYFGIISLDGFLSRIADIRARDLEKASAIQMFQFPDESVCNSMFYQVKCWNRMANKLGGDIIEVLKINESDSIVACFDVSGKNVAASLITMAVSSFFKMIKGTDAALETPVKIVSRLDDFISRVVPSGNFITGAICYVSKKSNCCCIFNCGHTTAYAFINDDKFKVGQMNPKLPPFGMGAISDQLQGALSRNEKPYVLLQLRPGLHIDFYSDGLTDMQNFDSVRFEQANTLDFFKELYYIPAGDVKDSIGKMVDTYTKNTMLADDISVVDIRF